MTNPIIGQEAPTPLDDLLEKFPDLPRTIIIKNDVMNWGIRYTPILNWVGKWSLPAGTMGYETHPEELKRGEISRSQEEGGLFDLPSSMKFRDGTSIMILIKKDTPYEIRYEGEGTYMLYWNGMAVEEVLFLPRPQWLSKKTKDGTPLGLILTPMGDTHLVTLTPCFCVYANTDEICWFCPLTMGQKELKKFGINKPMVITPEKVTEALAMVREEQYARGQKYLNQKAPCGQSNCRCLSWLITGGSIYDQEKEAERYIPYIEAVRQTVPEYNTYVETQACSPKAIEKLARAGLHGLNYNIEVWDKKMFYKTCPGKAKNITWERWTDWMAGAVPYFERGHVVSNQVLGLELQPPDGFKRLEEGMESVLEGHEWMTSRGVAPSWTPFITFTDTQIVNSPCPPTEYYLQIGIETHKMMLKHKLYTPTRFFFCCRACGTGAADFARLRWGDLRENEYRHPSLLRKEEVEVGVA